MKESKEERFRRVVEARVNKLIKMLRLLGNCSGVAYAYTPEQVEQIFSTLQTELGRAHKRYLRAKKKRFSLSDEPKQAEMPTVTIQLPDGTSLRAVAYQQKDYPSINVYWDSERESSPELICFAEYNPERSPCHELCIAAYQSHREDTTYYKPYLKEGDGNPCTE